MKARIVPQWTLPTAKIPETACIMTCAMNAYLNAVWLADARRQVAECLCYLPNVRLCVLCLRMEAYRVSLQCTEGSRRHQRAPG